MGGVKVLKEIEARGLKALRFSFADQHGVLRGKTLAASEAKTALASARSQRFKRPSRISRFGLLIRL